MSFLSLPPEIRLLIYSHLLNPSTYAASYDRINRLATQAYEEANSKHSPQRIPCATLPRFHVTRATPAILLVNRQITREALPILYSTELVLQGTPSTYFVFRQMDIAEFICETLLQKMRFVVLELASPNKLFVLALVDIWGRGNELERLVVCLPKDTRPEWNWGIVKERLRTFAEVEGIPLEMRALEQPKSTEE
ncbi:hypothetical protein BJX68DRAFT_242367 [Aspergillus pseudodeflectus]|uniref:2EXR domain-containing protein n=1 Tax=Aspergillus pseudodeflectus TaxID=176178 RepID=A0ABR4JYL6_9EURO